MIAPRRIVVAAAISLAGYVATGLTSIPQGEVGVVRRFGAALREPWPPGLHWGLPWGMDRVDRLSVDAVRTVEVGARDSGSARDDFLTGDQNLVSVRARVRYRVVRPDQFVFEAGSADATLASLAESALTRVLADRAIDDVLTTGRVGIADRMHRDIQTGADAHRLGVLIGRVALESVDAPGPVAHAFADAARAQVEQGQAAIRAEAYHDRALADARGQSREIMDRAAARNNSLVQSARGEAERFTKLLRAIQRNPQSARQRMYLDALAELLPRFTRKVVVAPLQEIDLSVIAGH